MRRLPVDTWRRNALWVVNITSWVAFPPCAFVRIRCFKIGGRLRRKLGNGFLIQYGQILIVPIYFPGAHCALGGCRFHPRYHLKDLYVTSVPKIMNSAQLGQLFKMRKAKNSILPPFPEHRSPPRFWTQFRIMIMIYFNLGILGLPYYHYYRGEIVRD